MKKTKSFQCSVFSGKKKEAGICSGCGAEPAREGQRYGKRCHAGYMRAQREKKAAEVAMLRRAFLSMAGMVVPRGTGGTAATSGQAVPAGPGLVTSTTTKKGAK